MIEHLHYLSQHSRISLSVIPNQGLPVVTADGTCYPMTPAGYAALARFVGECGVALVGGCCGTTPEHIRALAERLHDATPGGPGAPARGRRLVDLPPGAVRPGRLGADGGGADQRQRLQGVP